jgi:hypothetical protein
MKQLNRPIAIHANVILSHLLCTSESMLLPSQADYVGLDYTLASTARVIRRSLSVSNTNPCHDSRLVVSDVSSRLQVSAS